MIIKIAPGTGPSYEDLKAKLEERFPEIQFSMRGKGMLIGKKSSAIGVNIVIRKKRIICNGNFPTLGGTFLFVLCIVLLGVIIPFIIYLAAFHSKMKKLEKEIGTYIQELDLIETL